MKLRVLPFWLGSGSEPVGGNSLPARMFTSDSKSALAGASREGVSPSESITSRTMRLARGVAAATGAGAAFAAGMSVTSSCARSGRAFATSFASPTAQ